MLSTGCSHCSAIAFRHATPMRFAITSCLAVAAVAQAALRKSATTVTPSLGFGFQWKTRVRFVAITTTPERLSQVENRMGTGGNATAGHTGELARTRPSVVAMLP